MQDMQSSIKRARASKTELKERPITEDIKDPIESQDSNFEHLLEHPFFQTKRLLYVIRVFD